MVARSRQDNTMTSQAREGERGKIMSDYLLVNKKVEGNGKETGV
jgi:hypothetical protein